MNITSIGGKVSVPHLLPYTCAKFAAVGFSEGLRAELGSKGVRVVTIAPGLMRTGSYLNAFFKGDQEGRFGKNPVHPGYTGCPFPRAVSRRNRGSPGPGEPVDTSGT